MVNMIKSVMHAYQEDSIPTLFHLKSLLPPWGNFPPFFVVMLSCHFGSCENFFDVLFWCNTL